MTPIQREELDFDIKHLQSHPEKWERLNRWTLESRIERFIEKALPWVCAGLALAIAVIIGAEILWHLIAFLKN